MLPTVLSCRPGRRLWPGRKWTASVLVPQHCLLLCHPQPPGKYRFWSCSGSDGWLQRNWIGQCENFGWSKHVAARLENSSYLTSMVMGWLLPLLRLHMFTLIHRSSKTKQNKILGFGSPLDLLASRSLWPEGWCTHLVCLSQYWLEYEMVSSPWKWFDSFLETSVYILMPHLCPLLFIPEKSEMHASKVCMNTHWALFIISSLPEVCHGLTHAVQTHTQRGLISWECAQNPRFWVSLFLESLKQTQLALVWN